VEDLKKIVARLMKVGGFAIDLGNALYYKDAELQDSCTIDGAGIDDTAVVVMSRKIMAKAPDDELLRLQESLSQTLSANAERIIGEVGKTIGTLHATLQETMVAVRQQADAAEDEITAASLEELYTSIGREESEVFYDGTDADAVGNPPNLPTSVSGESKEALLVDETALEDEDGDSTKPQGTPLATDHRADNLELARSTSITASIIEEIEVSATAPIVDEERKGHLSPIVVEVFAETNDGAKLDEDVLLAFREPEQADDEPIEYSEEDSVEVEKEPTTFTIGQGRAPAESDDLQSFYSVDISKQDHEETLLNSEKSLPIKKKKSIFKRFLRIRKLKL